jgi:polar amino acid transport system substrate-binding protein
MSGPIRILLAAAALLLPVAAAAPQAPDNRIADLVHAGTVRIGMHLPQFIKDPTTGAIHGNGTGAVIEPIAQALADRIGVKLELVGNASPPKLVDCLNTGGCDVGFLGFLPSRANDVGYTYPYIQVPFTLMVPQGSPIHSTADMDKPGVRIAVVKSHASTLTLTRLLKNAETVATEIPDEAFELLRSGKVAAWAAPRPPLLEYAGKLPGSKVLDDHYGANLQSLAVPKGQAARLDFVSQFVEEAKASGLVQRAIDRVGGRGIEVAPPEPVVVTGTVPKSAPKR